MGMNGRFTESAQKAILLAQEEAKKFNHNYIGTEHLLLGLMAEDQGLAATTLKDGEALYIWAERTEDSLSDVDNVKEIEEGVYAIKAAGKDKITAADFAYAEVLSNGIVKVKDIAGDSTVKVKYTSSVAGEVTFKAALATSDDVVGQRGVAIGS